jgi:hypothetical protein
MKKFVYKIIILVLLVIIAALIINNAKSDTKTHTIKTLSRQAARWSTAANQDQHILIAVLHANYGAGYLWALRDIATDQEILNATGIDVLKFRDEITNIQDKTTRKLAELCPAYAPPASYLGKIAAEG